MLRIRLCEDRLQWNDALLGLGGTLYQSWEWGQIRSEEGWRPWRVLVEDGRPIAGLQLLEHRIPGLGFSVLYGPRGIAGADSDDSLVRTLAEWLRKFLCERRAVLLRLDPAFADADEQRKQVLSAAGFRAIPDEWSVWNLPRSTMVMDLKPSKEELLSDLNPKRRQYIRKAVRDNVEIVEAEGVDETQEFYEMLVATGGRRGFAVQQLPHFLNLQKFFLSAGTGKILFARHAGRFIAGLLQVRFGPVSYNLYNPSDAAHLKLHPNDLLHWRAIEWSKEQGCTEWDLIGSGTKYPPQEGNPGYGIYAFKCQLGARLRYSAGYFDLTTRPVLYQMFRLAETCTHGPLLGVALRLRSVLIRPRHSPRGG